MNGDQKTSVLFCDDEPRIIAGLRRQFRTQAHSWDMRFAGSGNEALALLEGSPADVVIADMRMPGMDGGTLLRHVRARWPRTVRIILSGQTDQGELLDSVGAIHQFLQKPIDAAVILHAVSRSMELATAIRQSRLHEVVSGLESLPVLSSTYSDLVRVIDAPDSTARDVAAVVSQDVGLSTKLLQLVNSSFFGLSRGIVDTKDAVALVGLDRLRTIAITSSLMESLQTDGETESLIGRLWRVSIDVGNCAAAIAREQGRAKPVQESARLAGLLSLIGRAILLREGRERYAAVLELAAREKLSLTTAESIIYGVPQHALGAYSLGIWAFSDEVVEAVARQAAPDLCPPGEARHPAWYVHEARCRGYSEQLADRLDPVADAAPPDEAPEEGGTGSQRSAA